MMGPGPSLQKEYDNFLTTVQTLLFKDSGTHLGWGVGARSHSCRWCPGCLQPFHIPHCETLIRGRIYYV